MALSVRTNMPAMTALRHNQAANELQADSFRKLSSGYRVYNASQDSAGLAVANNLDVRATSQSMAIRNANDGISMIQTAEGAINEVANMVRRMRELAVQSSSETLADTERQYVDDEFRGTQVEIQRIRDTINFNGQNLLDGNIASGLKAQVGADDNANNRISIIVDDITKVADSVAGGSFDLASGALDVNSVATAHTALQKLDDALNHMNKQRSRLGSTENQFNNAINYLSSNNEAIRSAESRIMDVDFAQASAQMSKAQTMSQASVAILAQANQLPQAATRLIG